MNPGIQEPRLCLSPSVFGSTLTTFPPPLKGLAILPKFIEDKPGWFAF